MKNSKPFRILLPAIICFIVISVFRISIEYYPLSFGLIIGISNWDLHWYKLYIGIFLSVILSYVCFFIAYFSIGLLGDLRDFTLLDTDFVISDDTMGQIAFLVGPFIISPILVFFSYRFIFNIPKSKSNLITIAITILLLLLLNYFYFEHYSSILNNGIENKILTPYSLWQVIMATALQLIIVQKMNTNET